MLCSKHAFTIHAETVMQDMDALIKYIRSKTKFAFDENTITGSYERLFKDPLGTLKKSFERTTDIYKKDINYLKEFLGKHKKKKGG